MSELVGVRWQIKIEKIAKILKDKGLDTEAAAALTAHLTDNPDFQKPQSDAVEIAKGMAAKKLQGAIQTCGSWCGFHKHHMDTKQAVYFTKPGIYVHQWGQKESVSTVYYLDQSRPTTLTLDLPLNPCIGQIIPDKAYTGQSFCPCGVTVFQWYRR